MGKKSHIFIFIMLVALLLAACSVLETPAPVHAAVTIEAGSNEIPLHLFPVDGQQVVLVTDTASIDLEKPGSHTLEFSFEEKCYFSTLVITDTTAPTGQPVAHTIYNIETLPADAFVTEVEDLTDVTVSFGVQPDFTKAGEHTVIIHLTDTSGNVGVVEAKLTILADTTFPVFSEMEDLVVNLEQTVSYRKGVSATDDRDGALSFTIDSSGVNLAQEGEYSIFYSATDSSGNTTTVERKIHVMGTLVVNQELVDEMAKEILAKILTDDMNEHDKIKKIYNYVRSNISYSSSKETDIPNAAYKAMTKRAGDCYNYFALAKLLLDNAGIDNLPVERYKGKSSHYWLLVNVGTGWYHYDASPQSDEDPFRCFMKTDAQVNAYARSRSDGRRDYYQIDYTKYPELATEKYSPS